MLAAGYTITVTANERTVSPLEPTITIAYVPGFASTVVVTLSVAVAEEEGVGLTTKWSIEKPTPGGGMGKFSVTSEENPPKELTVKENDVASPRFTP